MEEEYYRNRFFLKKKKKKKYVDIREARCYIKKKIKFLEYYVQRYMYVCVHSLFKVISSRWYKIKRRSTSRKINNKKKILININKFNHSIYNIFHCNSVRINILDL